MTNREYIQAKLESFGIIPEAYFADMSRYGICPDDYYDPALSDNIGKAIVAFVEEKIFSPKLSEMGDSGATISVDYGDLFKYYKWLCKKYGVTPSDDILTMMGESCIIDISNVW